MMDWGDIVFSFIAELKMFARKRKIVATPDGKRFHEGISNEEK